MKKFTLSIVVACAFCVATAVAQMAPGGAGQGTQQSSPGMNSPSQRGTAQPGQTDPMGQTSQTDQTGQMGNNSGHENGHEKKMKGCVQSQGGQYVLETKKGKAVALTGQDVSAHVGHEVSVKGTWEKGGSSSMSSAGSTGSSASSASTNEKTFNVTSVDMISDTCGGKSKEKSGSSSMGTGATGTNPNGSGTGTSGTGGTSTQPPQ
ncbi:MAG TPA: hypothetical protein VGU90_06030 [Terriglobales bacterium]|nr:hypothetical protein [Terriglobales bacterium]